MCLDPVDAFAELGVELHHPKRVERFDQGQSEVVILQREAFEATAQGLDLVLAPSPCTIVAPRPAHLFAHVLAERAPIRGSAARPGRGRDTRGAAAGKQSPAADRNAAQHLATLTERRLYRKAALRHGRRARSQQAKAAEWPANPIRFLSPYSASTQFRGVQEDVIDRVLAGKHTLAVMPTGAGKSLCYQLPARVRDGTALVISPLIALMHDQIRSAQATGICAASLTSADGDRQQTTERLRAGRARSGLCCAGTRDGRGISTPPRQCPASTDRH